MGDFFVEAFLERMGKTCYFETFNPYCKHDAIAFLEESVVFRDARFVFKTR